jgi:hypothetical protein
LRSAKNTCGGAECTEETVDPVLPRPWQRLPTLAPALADVVRLTRFHLAPLTCDTCLGRRIEAALAQHLPRQRGLVGSYQDAGIHYAPWRASEEPIDVRCQSSAVRLSLPTRLEAWLSPGPSPYSPASKAIRVYYALLGA